MEIAGSLSSKVHLFDICADPVARSRLSTGLNWMEVSLLPSRRQAKQVSCDLYVREISSIEAGTEPYGTLLKLGLFRRRQLEHLLWKEIGLLL